MTTQRTLRRLALSPAVLAISLVGVTGLAHANDKAAADAAALGGYVHGKLFGDYGPISVITGKPTPRYVNGKRVLPQEGWFSESMRGVTNKLHRRDTAQANGSRAQQFTRLTTENLTLDVPNGEWAQRPPGWNGNNSMMLYREDPSLVVSLAANRVGVEAKQTNDSLLAASQEAVRNVPNVVVLPEVRALSAPGLEGLTYQAKATRDDGQEILYSTWLAAKNGYTYEMAVYGETSNEQAIDQTTRQFVSRMREKEPNHVAYGKKKPSKWRFWK